MPAAPPPLADVVSAGNVLADEKDKSSSVTQIAVSAVRAAGTDATAAEEAAAGAVTVEWKGLADPRDRNTSGEVRSKDPNIVFSTFETEKHQSRTFWHRRWNTHIGCHWLVVVEQH